PAAGRPVRHSGAAPMTPVEAKRLIDGLSRVATSLCASRAIVRAGLTPPETVGDVQHLQATAVSHLQTLMKGLGLGVMLALETTKADALGATASRPATRPVEGVSDGTHHDSTGHDRT